MTNTHSHREMGRGGGDGPRQHSAIGVYTVQKKGGKGQVFSPLGTRNGWRVGGNQLQQRRSEKKGSCLNSISC